MNIAILLFDDVEVLDFAGPFEVFSVAAGLLPEGRVPVFTIAQAERPVRAIGGLRVLPDHTLASAPTPDVLVVPGGNGTRREMENAELVEWVKGVYGRAALVMSVCSGARILAKAGLLDGLRVTTHHEVIDHLRELAPEADVDAGSRFVDAGRILTTGGISAGIDGSFHVVARFFDQDLASRTAAYMEYPWDQKA